MKLSKKQFDYFKVNGFLVINNLYNKERMNEITGGLNLPEDFQKSEYLKTHGMVDLVIPRHEHKKKISDIIKTLTHNIN